MNYDYVGTYCCSLLQTVLFVSYDTSNVGGASAITGSIDNIKIAWIHSNKHNIR